MSGLSIRFLMSPRFFALPMIALAIIIALAHVSTYQSRSVAPAMAVHKAVPAPCSTARAAEGLCTMAGETPVTR